MKSTLRYCYSYVVCHTYEIINIDIEFLSVMEVWVNARLVQDYLRCALIQQLEVLRSVERVE